MQELAYMLLQACEEVIIEGKNPSEDAAVAVISGRIGFASPVDTMSAEAWHKLVDVCRYELPATIQIKSDALQ